MALIGVEHNHRIDQLTRQYRGSCTVIRAEKSCAKPVELLFETLYRILYERSEYLFKEKEKMQIVVICAPR